MRIAWFDPFSGASGDMVLGALVDAGAPLDGIRQGLAGLRVEGYELTAARTTDRVIAGTRLRVTVAEDRQPSRAWRDIRRSLESSDLPDPVRAGAIAIFTALAEAEAEIHGEPVERVHFHEVGGVDAIVDVVGSCLALHLLGVEAVFSSAPQAGRGMVRSRHGPLPVPAPATVLLMARAGAPIAAPRPGMEDVAAELLTPTGAALLATLAEFRQPEITLSSVGYGYGTKELPWPNALRVVIGEAPDAAAPGGRDADELLVETNLDDINPQFIPELVDRLLASGALDAWVTPVLMKKGRPGFVVSAIAGAAALDAVTAAFYRHSTTLGVRTTVIGRRRAARSFETVSTPWGTVRVKRREVPGLPPQAMPEFEDVRARASEAGISLAEVWEAARRAAG
jgi:pyridinium-3,5-bisthiocarboxylic acid mononucleotide nickel chelatase